MEAQIKRTVEDVYQDFQGRREGVIKALTTDVDKFYQECDPEKENLCLYGLPTGSWEVNVPVDEVPPELPEPILGINFSKEGMLKSQWLMLVAVHSDAWLISLAFYFGARFKFDKNDRKRLFQMINKLPTVYEVLTAKELQEINKTKPSGNMSQSRSAPLPPKREKMTLPPKEESDSDEEEADGQGSTYCGACGDDNGVDEFWICCDVCEKWYHGKCVKITPAKAKHIEQYRCPSCSSKKTRVH